jgi:hypothetical protein
MPEATTATKTPTTFPKTLAAVEAVEADTWTLAEAILDECGTDNSVITACAAWLSEQGIQQDSSTLAQYARTAQSFSRERSREFPFSIYLKAGTPEVLAEAVKQGKVTAKSVQTIRNRINAETAVQDATEEAAKAAVVASKPNATQADQLKAKQAALKVEQAELKLNNIINPPPTPQPEPAPVSHSVNLVIRAAEFDLITMSGAVLEDTVTMIGTEDGTETWTLHNRAFGSEEHLCDWIDGFANVDLAIAASKEVAAE